VITHVVSNFYTQTRRVEVKYEKARVRSKRFYPREFHYLVCRLIALSARQIEGRYLIDEFIAVSWSARQNWP
jgi:hypothetical protein